MLKIAKLWQSDSSEANSLSNSQDILSPLKHGVLLLLIA
jgi:hypothetical protein